MGRQIGTSLGRSNRIFRGHPGDAGVGRPWDVLGTNICRLGEFSSIPDTENTNEEEENSFVANCLLMLQQAQNNSISTKRTDSKSPDNKLDIELLIDLIRLFIAFGIHA